MNTLKQFGLVVLAIFIFNFGTYAQSIIVTSNNANATIGNLQWAIGQANSTPWADVIEFHPNLNGSTIIKVQQLPSITSPLIIRGNGRSLTKIKDINPIAGKMFDIVSGSSLVLEDLSIVETEHIVIHAQHSSSFRLKSCDFSRNWSSNGVIYSYTSTISINDCVFSNNNRTITADNCDVSISNSKFLNNSTSSASSALFIRGASVAKVVNSEFRGNTNITSSSDLFAVKRLASLTIEGSLISGNNGHSISLEEDATVRLLNCTVVSNSGELFFRKGFGVNTTSVELGNNIFAQNTYSNLSLNVNNISSLGGNLFDVQPNQSILQLQTSDRAGNSGVPLDMSFINPDFGVYPSVQGDYRIDKCSPAISRGQTSNHPIDILDVDGDYNTSELLSVDLAGDIRVDTEGGVASTYIIDAGAYEYQDNGVCTATQNPGGIRVALSSNPNNGFFSITLEEGKMKECQIFNDQGGVVYRQSFEEPVSNAEVDMRESNRGFYILKVVNQENGNGTIRFYKE